MKKFYTSSAQRILPLMKGLPVLLMLTFIINSSKAAVAIPLNDPKIYYDGVFYHIITGGTINDSVIFNRHTLAAYNDPESGIYWPFYMGWRNTQSGIRIRFQTASPNIYMQFSKRTADGGFVVPSPTNGFTVFADGIELISFSTLSFTISNPSPGTSVVFEVTLPNLWSVNFKGMQLDDTYTLDDPGANTKPVYAAFGTSITHGTGQYVSTAKTYPFKLAKCKDWNLYNFAVAGSIVGWQLAYNIKNKQVDYITVEQGFNDWYTDYPSSLTVVQTRYARFIDSLRKFQPAATIYCIAPIATTATKPSAPFTLEQFRSMVIDLVKARQLAGDILIHVVNGALISDASMLSDGIHLNETGAGQLATELCDVITQNIDLTPVKNGTDFKKSYLSISRLTTSEIIFNVLIPGNYSIDISTLDGKIIYSTKSNYFSEGRQTVSWTSPDSSYSNTCIVRVSNEANYYSELKLIEK